MKTKAAKQPKQSKRAVQVKDIKPKKNPAGGMKCTNNLKQMGTA